MCDVHACSYCHGQHRHHVENPTIQAGSLCSLINAYMPHVFLQWLGPHNIVGEHKNFALYNNMLINYYPATDK